jgi:hypothetical protein
MINYIKERMNMNTNIEYETTKNDILIGLLILFVIYQQKRINDLTNKIKCIDERVSIIEIRTKVIEKKIDYYENKLKGVFKFFKMIATFIENIYLFSIIIIHSILNIFRKR